MSTHSGLLWPENGPWKKSCQISIKDYKQIFFEQFIEFKFTGCKFEFNEFDRKFLAFSTCSILKSLKKPCQIVEG